MVPVWAPMARRMAISRRRSLRLLKIIVTIPRIAVSTTIAETAVSAVSSTPIIDHSSCSATPGKTAVSGSARRGLPSHVGGGSIQAGKTFDKADLDVRKAVDKLDFEVGETVDELPFAAIVGKAVDPFYLEVREAADDLDLDVRKAFDDLNLAAQIDALEDDDRINDEIQRLKTEMSGREGE